MQTTTNAHVRTEDRPGFVVHETGAVWLAIGDLTIFPPREAAAAWLRSLAVAAEELAEQVDLAANPGTVLADRHIAEAKAATGFGGAK